MAIEKARSFSLWLQRFLAILGVAAAVSACAPATTPTQPDSKPTRSSESALVIANEVGPLLKIDKLSRTQILNLGLILEAHFNELKQWQQTPDSPFGEDKTKTWMKIIESEYQKLGMTNSSAVKPPTLSTIVPNSVMSMVDNGAVDCHNNLFLINSNLFKVNTKFNSADLVSVTAHEMAHYKVQTCFSLPINPDVMAFIEVTAQLYSLDVLANLATQAGDPEIRDLALQAYKLQIHRFAYFTLATQVGMFQNQNDPDFLLIKDLLNKYSVDSSGQTPDINALAQKSHNYEMYYGAPLQILANADKHNLGLINANSFQTLNILGDPAIDIDVIHNLYIKLGYPPLRLLAK